MYPAVLVEVVRDTGFGSLCTDDRIGRGATLSDLNSDILRAIYQKIRKHPEIPRGAEDEFYKMVSEMPVLSAVKFADGLRTLQFHEWKWDSRCINDSIECSGGEGMGINAIAGGAACSMGNPRDATEAIRADFLNRPSISSSRSRGYRGYFLLLIVGVWIYFRYFT